MKSFTMDYWFLGINKYVDKYFSIIRWLLKGLLITVIFLGFQGLYSQVVVQGTAPVNTPNFGMEIDGDARAATMTLPGEPLGGDWFFAEDPDFPAQRYGAIFQIVGGELVPVYPDVVGDLPRTIYLRDDLALKGAIDATIFPGTNKINDDPNTYLWGPGNVQPKDEIQNVAVHFTRGVDGDWTGANPPPPVNDDVWCLFAADRAVTNGDSYIDFEFLQASLTMGDMSAESGSFVSDGEHGGRTLNDILISVAFSNGGAEPIVVVYEWTEVEPGVYEYVIASPGIEFFATSNTSETEVPFSIYDVPQNPDGTYTYEINQWVEGAFNLTALFNALSDSCINLSTLFIRTRSSGESNTSELSDFPVMPIALDIDFTPDPPTAESVAACESWNGTLTATCEEGTPRWYSDDNGEKGTLLEEGSSFSPGEITETTSYWVVCSIEGCEGDPTMVTVRIDDPVDAGENGAMSYCSDDDLSDIDLFALLGGTPDEGGSWTEGENPATSPIDLSEYDAGVYTFTYTVTPEEGSECEEMSADVVITIFDPVDAGENGAMSYCSDDDLSAIDLFALLEGSPDEDGSWAEGENPRVSPIDLSGYDAGVYTFTYTVTPEEGSVCEEDSADVVITIYDPVDAGENGSQSYCIDEDLSSVDLFALLEGTPDEGGAWTEGEDPATSPIDLSEYDAGVYTFTYTVTPEEGSVCEEDSADVVITIYDVVDAGENGAMSYCSDDDLSAIDLFALLEGSPDEGGSWSEGENPRVSPINLDGYAAGVYTFTYTITPGEGSVCEEDSADVVITIYDPVDAGENGSEAYCIDEDLTSINLFALLEGTPDEGGTWTEGENPAASPINLSAYDPGIYTFTYTVTPEEGSVCEEDSADVVITIYDVVSAGEGTTLQFCQGDPTQNMVNLFDLLNNEDGGGDWEDTDASGANISNPESVDFTSIPAGSYTFTYTISPPEGSECEPDSEEVEVIIDPLPDIPDYQTSQADCLGGDGGLVFTNVGENMYYSIDGGPFILYDGEISLAVGFYDFRIRFDEDGCISDEFEVEIQRPDEDIVILVPDVIQPDCDTFLGTIMITNAGELDPNLNYTVTNQDTSTDYYVGVPYPMGGFTGLPAGNYYVSVISDNGCVTGNVLVTLDEPICEEFEGCTLGYWKNHTDQWCGEYQTCTPYGEVFTNAPSDLYNLTLLEVLNLNGGGIYNLGRQSVAALLNACSEFVNYELSDVITYVNDNFDNADEAGSYLDMLNQAGCPLGGSSATTAPSEGCDQESGFTISPVPFKDEMTITYHFDSVNVTIQIFDMRGHLVMETTDSNVFEGDMITFNTDFVKGNQMYIVKVISDSNTYTESAVSSKK